MEFSLDRTNANKNSKRLIRCDLFFFFFFFLTRLNHEFFYNETFQG